MASYSTWDPEQIRKNARIWTLEGDANLLNLMQNISNNLEQHANNTTKNLNEMSEKLERTSIALDNTVNRLTTLSQTQFVENRVFDDDNETLMKRRKLENFKKIEECEKKTYDPVETLNTIIKNNMKMLGSCYEKITIDLDDSDDEEGNLKSILYRPKNPYESHPMPHLIGSREWNEKWHIGLCNSDESEQNSCEDDNVSESISLPSNGPTISESGSSVWSLNRQQQQSAKNLSILQRNVANKYSTPLSSDEEISSQTIASKTSSSEGNSKIVKSHLPEQRYYVHKPSQGLFNNNSDSDISVEKIPQPAPRHNKTINKQQTQVINIFNDFPPDLTESITENSQEKSEPKLFCDSDEDTNNLFQKKVDKLTTNLTPSIKKKAVNLFEDEDVDAFIKELEKKTTQKSIDIPKNISISSQNLKSEISQAPTQLFPVINEKISVNLSEKSTKANLFDDDDEDDLFLPISKPNKNNSNVKTKISNLFDDEPPDDDFDSLFSSNASKNKNITKGEKISSSDLFSEKKTSNQSESYVTLAPESNIFAESIDNAQNKNEKSEKKKTTKLIFDKLIDSRNKSTNKIAQTSSDISSEKKTFTQSPSSERNISMNPKTNIFTENEENGKNYSTKLTFDSNSKNINTLVKTSSTDLYSEKKTFTQSESYKEEVSLAPEIEVFSENLADSEASNVLRIENEENKKDNFTKPTVNKLVDSTINTNKKPKNLFDSDSSENENIFSTNKTAEIQNKNSNIQNIKKKMNKTTKQTLFDSDSSEGEGMFSINSIITKSDDLKIEEPKAKSLIKSTNPAEIKNSKLFSEHLFENVFSKVHDEDLNKKISDGILSSAQQQSEIVVAIETNKRSSLEKDVPNEISYIKTKIIFEDKNVPELNENINISIKINNNEYENEALSVNRNLIDSEKNKPNLAPVEDTENFEYTSEINEPESVVEICIPESQTDDIDEIIKINQPVAESSISESETKDRDKITSKTDSNIQSVETSVICGNLTDDSNAIQKPISLDYGKPTPDWLDSNFDINTSNLDSSSIKFSPHFISNEPPEDLKLLNETTEDPLMEEEDLFPSPIKNSNNINNLSVSALPYDPIGLFQDIPPPDEGEVFVVNDKSSKNKSLTYNIENVAINKQFLENDLIKNNLKTKTENDIPKLTDSSKTNLPKIDSKLKSNSVIKKLSTNLNINVAALIPGSKRPSFHGSHEIEQKTSNEEVDGNILISAEKEKEIISPKPELFTSSSLLHINKTRPKVSIKRRPQSREARQNSYRKSVEIENNENYNYDYMKSENESNLKIENQKSNISNQIKDENLSNTEKINYQTNKCDIDKKLKKNMKGSTPKTSIFFDDKEEQDWFTNITKPVSEIVHKEKSESLENEIEYKINRNANVEKPVKNVDVLHKSNIDTVSENIDGLASSTILNSKSLSLIDTKPDSNLSKTTASTKDKSNIEQTGAKQKNIFLKKDIKDPLFLDSDSEDNDLFKPTVPIESNESIKSKISEALNEPTSFLETSNVEEIFKKVKIKSKRNLSKNKVQAKTVSLFSSDEDDDDLFGSSSTKTKLTSKSEQKKIIQKKKSEPPSRFFDDMDDDDDLFGTTSNSKPTKVSKPKLSSITQQSDSLKKNSKENISEKSLNKKPSYNPLADLLNDN